MIVLGGKPLVQYTLEAALQSQRLSRTIFTTDDPEMMALGQSLGVEAPFRRPDRLATDEASSVDVVIHVLDWLKQNEQYEPDAVVLLQPTCPLRTAGDIDEAVNTFAASDCQCLISVSPVLQHPCDMVSERNGKLVWAVEPPDAGRRQLFPAFYFISGAIYIAETKFLRANRRFDGANAKLHIMEASHSIDIDDPFQLTLAHALISCRNNQSEG